MCVCLYLWVIGCGCVTVQEFVGVLSDASFTAHCHALATTRLDKPKSFANKAKEYWTEITTGFYHFERGEVDVSDVYVYIHMYSIWNTISTHLNG